MISSPGPSKPPSGRPPIADRRRGRVVGIGLLLGAVAGAAVVGPAGAAQPPGAPGQDGVAEEIRLQLEQLRETGRLELGGGTTGGGGLFEWYEPHEFAPLWDPAAARDLAAFVAGVDLDGLDPRRYGAAVLDSLAGTAPVSDRDRARRDLVFTRTLIQVAGDLRRGAVDPTSLGPGWADVPRTPPLPSDSLRARLTSGTLRRSLAELRPSHPIYRGLVSALAVYRAIQDAGGWPTVGEGPLLARDSVSARVPRLRVRLHRTGDLPGDADTLSTTFDATVEAAVKRFQHRHGLNDDGIVGAATVRALDVPVGDRVRHLRLNLERARWVVGGLDASFVTVNIAGQRVYLVRDGEVVWETRAVVGQPYTRTPVFRAAMRYLVVNPTWTVPRSINHEILARLRREPDYLRTAGFEVIDAAGEPVDPASIDFSRWSGADFPWVFRQRPGPTNSLGRIKFMFPNEYHVYLHDTPARSLFAREERTFSHGCIRVEDPLRLAELLFSGQGGPDRAELERTIASGETRTLTLDEPLPVLLLYWTASTDLHGEVHFYADVYGRDPALEEALLGGG